MFLFPLIHMVVFFLAIGADVHSIPLAFVNAENGSCPNFDITKSLVFNNDTDADDCEFTQMSCRFIEEVEDPMIDKVCLHYNQGISEEKQKKELANFLNYRFFTQTSQEP